MMLFMADCSEQNDVVQKEIQCEVGQLITPLTARTNRGCVWALDNGAFAQFDAKNFMRLLNRDEKHKDKCKFVACPDVVGSARRTLELFNHWFPELDGWPIALVAQDGQEDLPIPWDDIASVFIGGSTEFKQSEAALQIGKTGKAMGKWVHVGRINTVDRFNRWIDVANSFDGTGVSRFTWMRTAIAEGQPLLDRLEAKAGGR
jgi:hypothetical protein